MKTHKNISVFVPHAGCPYQCAFCNQHVITAQEKLPHAEDVIQICQKAMSEISDTSDTEIAFFGGSFTAIPEAYMLELLQSAQAFIRNGIFSGIRISTRPDCINRDILEVLKKYHVTSIELGAQSMSNTVLQANQRGHTREDVRHAVRLIRNYDFELGLQVMVGLYRSTWDDELETGWQVCELHPDTVRIYPVVILQHTRLAQLYQSGYYTLFPFDEVVHFTGQQMRQYHEAGIRVIKCGLHASEFVEHDRIAGYYHPAFRELCESEIYLHEMLAVIADLHSRKNKRQQTEQRTKDRTFAVRPDCISKAVGHKKSNLHYFAENYGCRITIKGDESLALYQVKLLEE